MSRAHRGRGLTAGLSPAWLPMLQKEAGLLLRAAATWAFWDACQPHLHSVQDHHRAVAIPSVSQSRPHSPSTCPLLRRGGHPFLAERSVCPQQLASSSSEPSRRVEWYPEPCGRASPFLPAQTADLHPTRSRPGPSHSLLFSHLCRQALRCPGERGREVGPPALRASPIHSLAPSLIYRLAAASSEPCCLRGPGDVSTQH